MPAGLGGVGYDDRPLTYALDDAKAAAIAAMTADTAANRTCRNTVVVLITAGKDSGDSTYTGQPQRRDDRELVPERHRRAATTKRVPIVVVGVKPAAADEAQLQSIATNSGGVLPQGHDRLPRSRPRSTARSSSASRARRTSTQASPASSCRSARSSAR